MLSRFNIVDADEHPLGILQTQLTEDELMELMDECRDTDEEGLNEVYNFNGLLVACQIRDPLAKEITTKTIYF